MKNPNAVREWKPYTTSKYLGKSFPYTTQGMVVTKERYESIWNKTKGYCAYCNCRLNSRNVTIDHIKPKSIGGTNQIHNLVLSCYSCNHKKGNKEIKPKFLKEK